MRKLRPREAQGSKDLNPKPGLFAPYRDFVAPWPSLPGPGGLWWNNGGLSNQLLPREGAREAAVEALQPSWPTGLCCSWAPAGRSWGGWWGPGSGVCCKPRSPAENPFKGSPCPCSNYTNNFARLLQINSVRFAGRGMLGNLK